MVHDIAVEPGGPILGAVRPAVAAGVGDALSAQSEDLEALAREIAETVPLDRVGDTATFDGVRTLPLADVDGGLIGGASLDAASFGAIIRSLKASDPR